MCCFNRPVSEVNKTRILVLPTKDGRQVTVSENVVGVSGGRGKKDEAKRQAIEAKQKEKYENAMILPAPLKAGSKVQLLDLSKDKFKFASLEAYFPHRVEKEKEKSKGKKFLKNQKDDKAPLEVHEVGAYFVSIAENLADLDRIDPTVFKVSSTIQELFGKHYREGFGFIICCFNPDKKIDGQHPIAYVHDVMADGRLFVPCRHEHGHGTKAEEHFDHYIYSVNTGEDAGMTRAEMMSQLGEWACNEKVSELDALRSDVLQPFLPAVTDLRRRQILGMFKNDDLIFVRA